MSNKYVDIWNDLHKNFINNCLKYDDWLEEYKDIINNIDTDIIDLGCGVTGNNTLYLLERGKSVISCDFAIEALNVISKIKNSKTVLFDMLDEFPFSDNYTDLIIADLSLHYFRKDDTIRIINEIKRVLKPNGYLFFRLNSTNSSEYKKIINDKVEPIEEHLYYRKNMEKKFFDENDIKNFFANFDIISLREENMSRWSDDKIVWNGVLQNKK